MGSVTSSAPNQPAQTMAYNQTRALHMRSTAFYVIERPGAEADAESIELPPPYRQLPPPRRESNVSNSIPAHTRFFSTANADEIKDEREDGFRLNSHVEEEDWDYVEEVSEAHCFAQALLFIIYGSKIQETGHRTEGHVCVTSEDKAMAKRLGARLLYGEMLPRGVNRACGRDRLNLETTSTFYDLGMGLGKVCLQVFIQHPHLKLVYGVELSRARYDGAAAAARKLARIWPSQFRVVRDDDDAITVQRLEPRDGTFRSLQFRFGSLLDVTHLHNADVVFLETEIPQESVGLLSMLLATMRPKAQILSYMDLRKVWVPLDGEQFPIGCPFRQMPYNVSNADRFETSWSVRRGHHFTIFEKLPNNFESDDVQQVIMRDTSPICAGMDRRHTIKNSADADATNAVAQPKTPTGPTPAHGAPPQPRKLRPNKKARSGFLSLFSSGSPPLQASPIRTSNARKPGVQKLRAAMSSASASSSPSSSTSAASGSRPFSREQEPPVARPSDSTSLSSGSTDVTSLSHSRGARTPTPAYYDEAFNAEDEEDEVDCNQCFRLLGTRSAPQSLHYPHNGSAGVSGAGAVGAGGGGSVADGSTDGGANTHGGCSAVATEWPQLADLDTGAEFHH
uniref:DOT1 domain-containing protein n=1 Tax=Phaeomonas parva TaxID=124430 RepID=A0A7S1U7X2_9STRA|mmetsp:Transcript_34272/g.108062  ORF Transcript_34272/g.108062 Transcript_34272/m.108062 type:complete len:622 (+) Transcript_34272:667-2532(+)